MTRAGKVMSSLNSVLPRFVTKPIWKKLSSNFAKGARGQVNVFQNATDGVRINSVWAKTEYDILKKNNTEIIYNNVFR